jgi:LL-diaminopimelate aminotransferase
MFVWAKIPDGFSDSMEFATELMEKAGVLVTPGSAFGPSGEGYARMALVQDEEALHRAAEMIEKSGILRKSK